MGEMTLRWKGDPSGETRTGPEGPVPEGFERVDKPEPTSQIRKLPGFGRTALDVILNPEGPIETAVSFPASMALTGGAGSLATKLLPNVKYAPALARSVAEGLQRGA